LIGRPDRVSNRLSIGSIPVKATDLSEPLRHDLLRYLAATSRERARLIGELASRNPGVADLLIDLEKDDDLRSRFEMELLRSLAT
jgi:hypothetical protein